MRSKESSKNQQHHHHRTTSTNSRVLTAVPSVCHSSQPCASSHARNANRSTPIAAGNGANSTSNGSATGRSRVNEQMSASAKRARELKKQTHTCTQKKKHHALLKSVCVG